MSLELNLDHPHVSQEPVTWAGKQETAIGNQTESSTWGYWHPKWLYQHFQPKYTASLPGTLRKGTRYKMYQSNEDFFT